MMHLMNVLDQMAREDVTRTMADALAQLGVAIVNSGLRGRPGASSQLAGWTVTEHLDGSLSFTLPAAARR